MPNTDADARARLIARAQKLLELSRNNTCEAEAMTAALAAQRLMAEHDLTTDEVEGTEPDDAIGERTCSPIERGAAPISAVANAVADNFRCRVYFRISKLRRGASVKIVRYPVFYGHETDAELAAMTFERLWQTADANGRARQRDAYRLRGTGAGVYNAYVTGFARGVRDALEVQAKALMVVTPRDVEEGFAQVSSDFTRPRASQRSSMGDPGAWQRGRDDGRDAVERTRMGGRLALE